jgi:hypothetical protein
MELCFQARAWHNKGMANALDLAASVMTLAVALYPDDGGTRFAAAEAAAAGAVSLPPESAVARMRLDSVEIYTNRASQGIRECERALELN